MDGESLFNKISSKYIIKLINSYSKEENLVHKLIV